MLLVEWMSFRRALWYHLTSDPVGQLHLLAGADFPRFRGCGVLWSTHWLSPRPSSPAVSPPHSRHTFLLCGFILKAHEV